MDLLPSFNKRKKISRITNSLEEINSYCEALSSPPDKILYELERITYLRTLSPQMISGRLLGQFLHFFSKMTRPQSVLEIGTFTGYATICLAAGLPSNGMIHTIEANEELEYLIRKYVQKSGLEKKVHIHMGDAKAIIPMLDMPFDLVFIDAAKKEYSLFYDLLFEKVNPGGYILADNVLWSGKVINNEGDADTQNLRSFNEKIKNDHRVENILLPIRDGVMIVRKF
ncbi:MAG: O-methyltransferase [Bacteroidetes bacterium]|nr:O-methyltransferase [Bacteroidota bacterium]